MVIKKKTLVRIGIASAFILLLGGFGVHACVEKVQENDTNKAFWIATTEPLNVNTRISLGNMSLWLKPLKTMITLPISELNT